MGAQHFNYVREGAVEKMIRSLCLLPVLAVSVFAATDGPYDLDGRTGNYPAVLTTGGGYELSGTVTRPDKESAMSGRMTAGDYSLTGEFPASAEIPVSVPCPADLLEPSGVGVGDLLELLDSWGETDSPADLDGDCTVGILDLLTLLANWGPCP